MEAEPSANIGAPPSPEAEIDAKIVAKGEFGLAIGHLELMFPKSKLSVSEEHIAAILHLIRAGALLREQSYAKYLSEPLVTEIPMETVTDRADVRLCGYGLGKYSVESGSIRIETLLLIGISFHVLNFSYDAVSKYPAFKEGLKHISEDLRSRLGELEAIYATGDSDENEDAPSDFPTIVFVANRPEEIFEELRKQIGS